MAMDRHQMTKKFHYTHNHKIFTRTGAISGEEAGEGLRMKIEEVWEKIKW